MALHRNEQIDLTEQYKYLKKLKNIETDKANRAMTAATAAKRSETKRLEQALQKAKDDQKSATDSRLGALATQQQQQQYIDHHKALLQAKRELDSQLGSLMADIGAREDDLKAAKKIKVEAGEEVKKKRSAQNIIQIQIDKADDDEKEAAFKLEDAKVEEQTARTKKKEVDEAAEEIEILPKELKSEQKQLERDERRRRPMEKTLIEQRRKLDLERKPLVSSWHRRRHLLH